MLFLWSSCWDDPSLILQCLMPCLSQNHLSKKSQAEYEDPHSGFYEWFLEMATKKQKGGRLDRLIPVQVRSLNRETLFVGIFSRMSFQLGLD